jgi:hypothetical protein
MKPERRKPGRPRLDDDDASTTLSVRVTLRMFNQACDTARLCRLSVPEMVRQSIRQTLKDAGARGRR